MSKYDTPEWTNSPIRSQIREALKEIERVKAAWQALERLADGLDAYNKLALEHRATWRAGLAKKGADGIDNLSKVAFGRSNEASVYAAARRLAEIELKQLDGWMLSLIESEIGLNAMLHEGYNSAFGFVFQRTDKLRQIADRWASTRAFKNI